MRLIIIFKFIYNISDQISNLLIIIKSAKNPPNPPRSLIAHFPMKELAWPNRAAFSSPIFYESLKILKNLPNNLNRRIYHKLLSEGGNIAGPHPAIPSGLPGKNHEDLQKVAPASLACGQSAKGELPKTPRRQ